MTRKLTYIIKKEFHNKSIRIFLEEMGFCHQTIVYLKQTTEGICINGKWVHIGDLLQENDTLSLQWQEPVKDQSAIPQQMDLDIVYEDEDLIVINKKANTPVHPSAGHHEQTLANGIVYYFQSRGLNLPFRCINRLDKDTTGLTIIAKNCQAAGILSQSVSNRTIQRTYLAIVEGKIDSSREINAPIARKQASTIERCIDYEHGERAITHCIPLKYNEALNLSLVELHLETGRTHQIRVHMKHIGHPLIGDFLYNPNYQHMERQSLHSYQLDFLHPLTKKEMHFTAPLPSDMNTIFPDY